MCMRDKLGWMFPAELPITFVHCHVHWGLVTSAKSSLIIRAHWRCVPMSAVCLAGLLIYNMEKHYIDDCPQEHHHTLVILHLGSSWSCRIIWSGLMWNPLLCNSQLISNELDVNAGVFVRRDAFLSSDFPLDMMLLCRNVYCWITNPVGGSSRTLWITRHPTDTLTYTFKMNEYDSS